MRDACHKDGDSIAQMGGKARDSAGLAPYFPIQLSNSARNSARAYLSAAEPDGDGYFAGAHAMQSSYMYKFIYKVV